MSVEKAIHLLRLWIYINVLASACARRPENLTEAENIIQCEKRNIGYYKVAPQHICCMCYPGSFRIEDCKLHHPTTTKCGTCMHNNLIQTFTSADNDYRSCNISKTESDCKALMYTRLQRGNNSMDNKCLCINGTYAIDSEISGCKIHTKCAPGYGVERPGDATHDVVCRLCPAGTCSYKYSDTERCTPTADPCNVTSTSGTFSEGDSMLIMEKSSSIVSIPKGVLAAICILTLICGAVLMHLYSKYIKDSNLKGSRNSTDHSDVESQPAGSSASTHDIVDLSGPQDRNGAQPSNGHARCHSGGNNDRMDTSLNSEEAQQDTDPLIQKKTLHHEDTIIEHPEAPAALGNQNSCRSNDSTPSGDEANMPSEDSTSQVEQDHTLEEDKTKSTDDQHSVSDQQFEDDMSIFDDPHRDKLTKMKPDHRILHEALASKKQLERMCNDLVNEVSTPTVKEFLRNFELVPDVRMDDIERENKDKLSERRALLTEMRNRKGTKLDPRAIIQKAKGYEIGQVYDELCKSFIGRLQELINLNATTRIRTLHG